MHVNITSFTMQVVKNLYIYIYLKDKSICNSLLHILFVTYWCAHFYWSIHVTRIQKRKFCSRQKSEFELHKVAQNSKKGNFFADHLIKKWFLSNKSQMTFKTTFVILSKLAEQAKIHLLHYFLILYIDVL